MTSRNTLISAGLLGIVYSCMQCAKNNTDKVSDKAIYNIIDSIDPIDRNFYRTLIRVESSDNPLANSKVGARGLMQITEATWHDMTDKPFSQAYDPEDNIEVGIRYVHWIETNLTKNVPDWQSLPEIEKKKLVAASYNGGVNRLRNKSFNIEEMPGETRHYVDKVSLEYGRRIWLRNSINLIINFEQGLPKMQQSALN